MEVRDISDMIEIPEEDKRDVDVFVLSQEEWDGFQQDLNKILRNSEELGLTIMAKSKATIVINDSAIHDDLRTIILAHEYGHVMRGASEEAADTYAIEEILLDDDAEKLIVLWPSRHGRTYGESTI